MGNSNKDIGFTRENNWFRYRAAAIIIQNGNILMVGNDHNDYFYSLGGAVQLGETAEEACLREVNEETGMNMEIERLAFIHENFFTGQESDFLQEKQCHGLSFYFLMKVADEMNLHSQSFGVDDSKEFLKWIPIKDYANYKAFPNFFAQELLNLPVYPKRIVSHG